MDPTTAAAQSPVIAPTLNLPLFNTQGDQFDASLYDRLGLLNAAGAIERDFYAVGVGGTDPITTLPKTYADTNVVNGQIQEGTAFAGFVLKFFYEPFQNKAEDDYIHWVLWARQTVIQVDLPTKKDYGTWKLTELFGNPNYTLLVPGTAGNFVAFQSVGSYQSLKQLNLYIPLPRLTDFRISMTQYLASDTTQDGDFLVCSLVGVKNSAG